MTDLIEKLEALAKAATPGPWEIEDDLHTPLIGAETLDGTEWIICDLGLPCDLVGLNTENLSQRILDERSANAALIVELVNNLPTILRHLRERDEAVEALREIADFDYVHAIPGTANCEYLQTRSRAILAKIEGAEHE